ncbi:MAG: AhpC/TSA family protein, partial [Planctomycetota bacterium]
ADAHGERRYPKVVFLHQGTPRQGEVFFGHRWPGTAAISDPQHRLYDALHLRRGNTWNMFRPVVWWLGFKAMLKGHFIGKPVGDPWRMPGLAMVDPPRPGEDATIRWQFRFEHAGSRPDYDTLVDAAGPRMIGSDIACETDACKVPA